LSEDFSDPSFLEAVFDAADDEPLVNGANKPAPNSRHTKDKGHRRMVSAPVKAIPPLNFDLIDPDPKRSKPNSPNYSPREPFEDNMQGVAFSQNITGINFPSPQVQMTSPQFHIGTNEDTSTKKSHRRNRTFGGYSCSDANVSELPMADIFAIFLDGRSEPQQQQQQLHETNASSMISGALPQSVPNDVSQVYEDFSSNAFSQQLFQNDNQMPQNNLGVIPGVFQQDLSNDVSQLSGAFNQQLCQNEIQMPYNEIIIPGVFQQPASNDDNNVSGAVNQQLFQNDNQGAFQLSMQNGISQGYENFASGAINGNLFQNESHQQLLHNNHAVIPTADETFLAGIHLSTGQDIQQQQPSPAGIQDQSFVNLQNVTATPPFGVSQTTPADLLAGVYVSPAQGNQQQLHPPNIERSSFPNFEMLSHYHLVSVFPLRGCLL
jgi:hypothetical protein